MGPDNGRDGRLDADVTGDAPTAAIACWKGLRRRGVMTCQLGVGSLWRRRLGDCGPLGSAHLKRGRERYDNLPLGRVRGRECMIVAWVGIGGNRNTDQE